MRALLFFLTVCLLSTPASFAQSPGPSAAAAWKLKGMQGEAAVILFHPDSARVQKESTVLSFRIVRRQGIVSLADKKEDARVLNLLGTNAGAIAEAYGPDAQNLLPTEKLLTAAARLPDSKLLLESAGSAGADTTGTPLAQEEVTSGGGPDREGDNPWLYAGIAAVLALLVGWIAGRASRGKTGRPATTADPVKASHSDSEASASLKAALQRAEQDLQTMQASDRQLFSGAFEKLVLPLQTSLEQGDKARTLALLTECAAMLGSMARHKLAKKGKHDDANLRLLTGAGQASADAPVITGQTPPDQTPHNLRVLIALLRDNGVAGLDGVLVQGYDIRDL